MTDLRLYRQIKRVVVLPADRDAVVYRMSKRIVSTPGEPEPAGATIPVWTGAAWEPKPVSVWTGTAWDQATALKRWTGSDWEPV